MTSSPVEPSPKVFVSYSRRDMAFVDDLDAALRARGVEPLIDRAEIFAFEDWWKRIEDLISQADTIIFVLSPDAVASDVCRREVEYAGLLNKRFAPVVARAVDPAKAPEALRRLNFIHLDSRPDFETGIERLVEALATDIDWVRRHSEFGEMARRWAQAGRPGPQGMLLRSPLLEEAERWIASRPGNAPPPTEATQTLILTSRRAATRRRSMVSAALAIGLAIALLLGGVAFWQRQIARENERVAVTAQAAETTARQAEAEQRRLAEARERQAIEAGNRTLTGQSRFLADASARSLADQDAGTAVLLALEALPDRSAGLLRPLVPEARQALDRGLAALAERPVALRHAGFSLAFSADGRRFASQGGEELIVGDTASGKVVLRGQFGRGETVSLDLGADGRRVLRCSASEVQVVDVASSGTQQLDLSGTYALIGPLVACSFAPDGARVLLADGKGRAGWWDGRATEPEPLDLSPGLTIFGLGTGGATILASAEGTSQVRDASTGRVLASLPGEGGAIEALQSSRDGDRVLVVERDRLRLLSVETGTAVTLAAPRKAVVQFSPDGRRLVLHDRWPMNSRGGGFELWDAESGRRIAVLEDAARLIALTFSPDGRQLVGAGSDGSIRVFDAEGGRETRRLMGHQARALATVMSPDGRSILSSGFDTRLILWNIDAARPSRRIELHGGATAVAPLADGGMLAATAGGSLRFWRPGPDAGRIIATAGSALLALSASSPRALATARDGSAILVDTENGREIARLVEASGLTLAARGDAAVFSPDGTRFVALTDGKTIAIHDAQDGREVSRHHSPVDRPSGVAFADDAHVLVWSTRGEAVHLDARTGEVRSTVANVPLGIDGRPMPPGAGAPDRLAWAVLQPSPDGRRLVTWDFMQPRVWDLTSGRLLHILQDHAITGAAGQVGFSPDGATLFTVERGRIVTAWEVETGRRIRSFSGHTSSVTVLRVSPDGHLLLTGAEDRTARIWDAASGIEIAAFTGHGGPVVDVRFRPGGSEVVTASTDGIRSWPIARDVQEDVERAKASMGRCLTQEQRRRFYLDPIPPDWCFAGPHLEAETDPAKWQPRAPYHMPLWQSWYRDKRSGGSRAFPRSD